MNELFPPVPSVATKPFIMLKVSEVAAICGVSQKTVYRWIANDQLAVHRLPGSGSRGITLISPEDLTCWLRKHRVDPAATDKKTMRLEGRRLLKGRKRDVLKQA